MPQEGGDSDSLVSRTSAPSFGRYDDVIPRSSEYVAIYGPVRLCDHLPSLELTVEIPALLALAIQSAKQGGSSTISSRKQRPSRPINDFGRFVLSIWVGNIDARTFQLTPLPPVITVIRGTYGDSDSNMRPAKVSSSFSAGTTDFT